ncbi:hypothetical protein Dimus_003356 [Dionaea muscipula]
MASAYPTDQILHRHEPGGRMAEWMGRDLNWKLSQSFKIVGQLVNVTQEALVDRAAAWKKVKSLEEEIVGLLQRHKELSDKYDVGEELTELELQRPASMDEMVDLWQVSEEEKAAITELSRPSTKAGYNMAYQHFASYLSKVPADKKWDGLPWPHVDIGVTDQNIPYYIADGPPPPIVVDAGEEEEEGEVNIIDP